MHLLTFQSAHTCQEELKQRNKVFKEHSNSVHSSHFQLQHHSKFGSISFFFVNIKLPTAPLSRQPFLRALVHFLGLRGEVPSSGVKGVSSSGVKGVGLHQVLKVQAFRTSFPFTASTEPTILMQSKATKVNPLRTEQ